MRRFLPDLSRGSRVRLAVFVTAGAALLAAPSAGAGGQAGYSCPSGHDLGALTVDQALALPRIAAGIAASGGDPSGFIAFFNLIDKNSDQVICGKTQPAGNGTGSAQFQYQYNFVDDNSSATTA